MLNAQRSGGDGANDETFEQFQNAGVAGPVVQPQFYVTHEKSIVVDDQAALVATLNLMEKYFTLTRDYGIITDDPYHVSQIVRSIQR
jgi:cardiolipin synthase A/B